MCEPRLDLTNAERAAAERQPKPYGDGLEKARNRLGVSFVPACLQRPNRIAGQEGSLRKGDFTPVQFNCDRPDF